MLIVSFRRKPVFGCVLKCLKGCFTGYKVSGIFKTGLVIAAVIEISIRTIVLGIPLPRRDYEYCFVLDLVYLNCADKKDLIKSSV